MEEIRRGIYDIRGDINMSDTKEFLASADFIQEECDETDRKSREFSLSRGDVNEQKSGIFDWDMAKDISRFSKGVCNMLGVEQSHISRGLYSVFQYIPPEEWQRLQDSLMQCVQNKTPFDVQCSAVRSDGTPIRIHVTGKFTCDNEGNPCFMEGTLEDITGQQE